MRGRKPKPAHLLQGTYSRAELKRRQSFDGNPVVDPDPPVKLEGSALALWRRLLPQLKAVGILSQTDVFSLALVCQTFDEAQRAYRLMQECSDHQERETLFRRWLKALDAFRRFGVEFGLTPSSRVRLAAAPEPTDELEAILGNAEAGARFKH